MSQRVPSWNLDDPPNPSHLHPSSSSAAAHPQLSMSDNEVAELTWENGHLSVHGLVKTTPRQATGTLESVVDQAKLLLPSSSSSSAWHQHQPGRPHLVDALVPRAHINRRRQRGGSDDLNSGIGSCNVDRGGKRARPGDTGTAASIDSTRVVVDDTDDFDFATTNSVTPPFPDDGNGVSESHDTENTSFGGGGGSRRLTVVDDHDSVCRSLRSLSQRKMAGEEVEKITEGGTMRSTNPTKRSRATAVHNQSERKRRDRINQKMRTLQKLVPNSSKTDKASMLGEVIEYLKQLQAQVLMMSRISSISPMMMPVSMQQFQMTMMTQMAQMAQMGQVGMGMGMMDMASLARTGPAGISPVMPAGAFLPMIGAAGAWDPSAAAAAAAEMLQQPAAACVMPAAASVMPDRFSTFVACPPQQQMTMDAYQRMAALYPQMFQPNQPTNPK